MPITNPNPITPAAADKLWLTAFYLTRAAMSATAQPWDAANNLLVGNPSNAKRIASLLNDPKEAAAKTVADGLAAQVARLAGTTADKFSMLRVDSSDPSKPVTAKAQFSDPAHREYAIPDLFAAIGGDPLLATAYAAVLAWAQTKIGA
jgi:rhamnose utilization protein RhaD (predicted bifunctional aldolase and dehydrogenase)